MDNAASGKQVKEARVKEKMALIQAKDDMKFVLGDPKGRRFIMKYLALAGFYRNEFFENPDMRAFRDGQKNLASKILMDILEIDEDIYAKMIIESKEKH